MDIFSDAHWVRTAAGKWAVGTSTPHSPGDVIDVNHADGTTSRQTVTREISASARRHRTYRYAVTPYAGEEHAEFVRNHKCTKCGTHIEPQYTLCYTCRFGKRKAWGGRAVQAAAILASAGVFSGIWWVPFLLAGWRP